MIPQTSSSQVHSKNKFFDLNQPIKESEKPNFTKELKNHLQNIYHNYYNKDFNDKFEIIRTEYTLNDSKSIRNVISNNKNYLELLIQSKSKLDFYFKDCHFLLKIFNDSEKNYDYLGLIIQADPNKLSSELLVGNLLKFNSYIRPLKRRLGLVDNFFVDVEYL